MLTTVTTSNLFDRIEHRDESGRLLCNVCASTVRVGDTDVRCVPAVWVWLSPNGNRSYVCDACFAWWMKFAVDDGDPPAGYHRVRADT